MCDFQRYKIAPSFISFLNSSYIVLSKYNISIIEKYLKIKKEKRSDYD